MFLSYLNSPKVDYRESKEISNMRICLDRSRSDRASTGLQCLSIDNKDRAIGKRLCQEIGLDAQDSAKLSGAYSNRSCFQVYTVGPPTIQM